MRSASQPASRMPPRFSTDKNPKAFAEVVGEKPHSVIAEVVFVLFGKSEHDQFQRALAQG